MIERDTSPSLSAEGAEVPQVAGPTSTPGAVGSSFSPGLPSQSPAALHLDFLRDPQTIAALKYALRFAESPTPCTTCPMYRECMQIDTDPWPCEWVPGKLKGLIEATEQEALRDGLYTKLRAALREILDEALGDGDRDIIVTAARGALGECNE